MFKVNRALMGTWVISQEIVHNVNGVMTISIERYTNDGKIGYVFFQHKDGGKFTNFVAYPTVRRCINAAAKL